MVDVVIPVYKPDKNLQILLKRLLRQKYRPNRIILINTEKEFFDDAVMDIDSTIEVHHISKDEFDHGATRHMGMEMSDAEYVLFMTMDAIPADSHLIENLLRGMERKGPEGEVTAATYARQLPRKNCRMQEQYTRKFNYPEGNRVKTLKDREEMGIKAYFLSDVCAMYDRKIYYANGGFGRKMIFNEDMVYAATAIENGYAVTYCGDARVIHSHNYTCMEQLRRNFDLGVSHKDNADVFDKVPPVNEGKKLVVETAKYLWDKGHFYEIPYLICSSAAKYIGYKLGKNYKKLTKNIVMKLTSNKSYWNDMKE